MTTLSHQLSEDPVDIKAALSLADDSNYSAQFKGQGTCLVAAAGSQPAHDTPSSKAFRAYDPFTIQVTTEPVWAWIDNATKGGGHIAVDIFVE